MNSFSPFSPKNLAELLAPVAGGPCISIYQPTHRQHPENVQDPIRFGNLVRRAADSLRRDHSDAVADAALKKFHALSEDAGFWNHSTDGLAVFGSADLFHAIRLQRPVTELTIVAQSFHVKPLLRIVQSTDRFQVLAINRRDVRLFEGNRDALNEIALDSSVPQTATDVLGDDVPEPQGQAHSYGTGPAASGAGSNRNASGAKTGGMGHGHGSKSEVIDQQTERFFRAVDRAVLAHHSSHSALPLILAALPEHHAAFQNLSHNPHLVKPGITINPEALTMDQLRERAWQVMEPVYTERIAALSERFGSALGSQLGDDQLSPAAKAAAAGRVAVLLLEADKNIPGRLDTSTGHVQMAKLDHPDVDDALDDLAEQVLRMGGEVLVLPAERMPTTTGLAAIYRY